MFRWIRNDTYPVTAAQTGFDFRWPRISALVSGCNMTPSTPWISIHVLAVMTVSHYTRFVNIWTVSILVLVLGSLPEEIR